MITVKRFLCLSLMFTSLLFLGACEQPEHPEHTEYPECLEHLEIPEHRRHRGNELINWAPIY